MSRMIYWGNIRGYSLQLKLGPGNAWTTARPSRKSLEDTQPSATIYLRPGIQSSADLHDGFTHSRSSGITTGPPPNII